MSNEPRAPSPDRIAQWIRYAATAEPWRPGHQLDTASMPAGDANDPYTRVHSLLQRARSKTFVRMAKPFRRMFRNQGAVNDSLIDAVHQLAEHNEQIREEVSHLGSAVAALREEVARISSESTTPTRADELSRHSPGVTDEASRRDGECA